VRLWLHLVLGCCVAAPSIAGDSHAEPLHLSGATMGTTYRVILPDADPDAAPRLRAAVDEVFADVDRRLSTYRNDSEISRFNRAPAKEWFPVSSTTAEIVAASLAMSRQTEGALDITVGPLVQLWHFGPAALTDETSSTDLVPPDEAALRAARARVGYGKLDVCLDPPRIRKRVHGLELVLSAVGEGYAIDRVAVALGERGYMNFLIELGGEIRTSGAGPGGKPWRVAIQRPSTERAEMQSSVLLSNASIATSGDYRRYFEHEGRRFSHIIDPRTGRPIDHALASVTVVADDALTADAWDTALLVLGAERGYDCAVEHEIAALFISREGGRFVVQETPVWQKRFATASNLWTTAPRRRSP
jgi:thiamine biosynthesis lipoprotein